MPCALLEGPWETSAKAVFALGFHLLGVSLPALQVNLRNHLAHPPGPGNATTMPMEPNSCGPHPADAHGPVTSSWGLCKEGRHVVWLWLVALGSG